MRELEIVVGIDEAETPELVRARAADALGRRAGDLGGALVVRRSLDARKGRAPVYRLRLRVFDVGEVGASATTHVEGPANPATGVRRGVVVVVGAGPAGSFAARTLVRAGVGRVLVCELGKPVQARRHDIAALVRRGVLAPDSNYCFGEGGAGTFSDGKLYTRSKDRERVAAVLAALVGYGADPEIEIDSRPHVGSNHLPKILLGLRADLEARGVEYRWQAPLVDLVVGDGGRVRAVRLGGAAPEELACDAVVLATGHSARPVYELLARLGVALAPKAFAVGARVEHPQPLIDELQYGRAWARHPRLPAAFYQLTTQAESRGVYSFCMCPGGWVVDSSTEPGMLAWTLCRELEQLTELALAARAGQPLVEHFSRLRIWQSRQQLIQQALTRLPVGKIQQLWQLMARLDDAQRRFDTEQAWLMLQTIALGFRDGAPLPLLEVEPC